MRLFAYFAVKKPLKQLTAKSAKNAKITQRVELRTLPEIIVASLRVRPLFAPDSGRPRRKALQNYLQSPAQRVLPSQVLVALRMETLLTEFYCLSPLSRSLILSRASGERLGAEGKSISGVSAASWRIEFLMIARCSRYH